MSSAFPTVVILAIVLGLMAASYVFVPKGPNQVVLRTALMIGLAACYLMWAIAYLAQLHPLMAPQRALGAEE